MYAFYPTLTRCPPLQIVAGADGSFTEQQTREQFTLVQRANHLSLVFRNRLPALMRAQLDPLPAPDVAPTSVVHKSSTRVDPYDSGGARGDAAPHPKRKGEVVPPKKKKGKKAAAAEAAAKAAAAAAAAAAAGNDSGEHGEV